MPKHYSRYLLLDVSINDSITLDVVYSSITRLLLHLFGEFGLASINLRKIYSKDSYLVIRCRRETEHQVRSGILLLGFVFETPVKLSVIKSSGTLKSIRSFLRKPSPNDL